MNQKEWKKSGNFTGKHKWYNKTRKLQKSLRYESDPNATIIHHLRDTEEQRKYNDEHYELWGHNLDGTFEYGKYVAFWTKEKHDAYHSASEETRRKIGEASKSLWTEERREQASINNTGENNPMYGKYHSDEAKKKMSDNHYDCSCENNPMYGKHHSKESCEKMSMHRIGENNPFYGKSPSKEHIQKLKELFTGRRLSDETKRKISESKKMLHKLKLEAYNEYIANGGTISKAEFFKQYKNSHNK